MRLDPTIVVWRNLACLPTTPLKSLKQKTRLKLSGRFVQGQCFRIILLPQAEILAVSTVFGDWHPLSKSMAQNVQTSIEMQLQAVATLSREDNPRDWGIFHHNIGLSYISLAHILANTAAKLVALDNSVAHQHKAFEVRNPDITEEFQYWVASSRSLAEALIDKGIVGAGDEGRHHMSCARAVLEQTLARVDQGEHPHQWAELQDQLARLTVV